jgi:hypothetical protein
VSSFALATAAVDTLMRQLMEAVAAQGSDSVQGATVSLAAGLIHQALPLLLACFAHPQYEVIIGSGLLVQ